MMAESYIIPQELKSPTKFWWKFYITDFFFVFIYFIAFKILDVFVDSRLLILYYIFNLVIAIILTSASPYNARKRIYHSLLYMITKDRCVYHPIAPPSLPIIQGNIITDAYKLSENTLQKEIGDSND